MSIRYAFPFCTISNFGKDKIITGRAIISLPEYGISTSKEFSLPAQTWAANQASDEIVLEIEDGVLMDNTVNFSIAVEFTDLDDIALFYPPLAGDNTTIKYRLRHRTQEIPSTQFYNKDNWFHLPLKLTQIANVTLTVIVEESIDDVVDFLVDSVTYRKELTYLTRPQTKPEMSPEDNIEYYLGKDTFKNLFFNSELPPAWEIPARLKNTMFKPARDITITPSDGIEYTYNNLGYRSKFDYTKESLEGKKIILCLGDSDLFGFGVPFDDIWSEVLQKTMPDTVVLNLGIKGISADTIARLGVKTIGTLSASIVAVCVHWPHTSLREFVSKKYKGVVHTHRNYDLPYADWWDHIDWQSNNYNFYKNKILLESTCAKFNIPYHDIFINKDDDKVPLDAVGFGVYTSIGPLTHRALASYFYKKIKNQASLFESKKY